MQVKMKEKKRKKENVTRDLITTNYIRYYLQGPELKSKPMMKNITYTWGNER